MFRQLITRNVNYDKITILIQLNAITKYDLSPGYNVLTAHDPSQLPAN